MNPISIRLVGYWLPIADAPFIFTGVQRKPANESKRLEALHQYNLLDSDPETAFDDFVHLAAFICSTPIALITLVDSDRQWFKAKVGIDACQTPREDAFCSDTILATDVMIVEDASRDTRYATNPLVTSDPHIRFYAGAPLIDSNGFELGSLCVIDSKPRTLPKDQQRALEALARQVVAQCEFRRVSSDLAAALADIKALRSLIPICSHCKSVRNDQGYWKSIEEYLSSNAATNISHGICPKCVKAHHPEFYNNLDDQTRARLGLTDAEEADSGPLSP